MPDWLLDLFARYGYAVVFGGVFLENTGLPVPGETALLAGAALAHYGQLSLFRVIVDRHRRRDAGRQPRLLHRSPRRPAHRRAPRLADRPDQRTAIASSIASSSGTARRPCSPRVSSPGCAWSAPCWRAAVECAGRCFSFYNAAGAVVVVHGGRGCGILAGVQLGDAGALDRPQRSDRAGGRGSAWYHRSGSRATESSHMITLASGLSYLDLHFYGVPGVIASVVLHGPGGAAIIDPGPSSTLPALRGGLERAGIAVRRRALHSADPHSSRSRRRHRHAGAREPGAARLRARERRAAHGRSVEADRERDAAVGR